MISGTFCFFSTSDKQTGRKRRKDPMNTIIAISTIFLCMLFGAITAIGLKKDDRNDK